MDGHGTAHEDEMTGATLSQEVAVVAGWVGSVLAGAAILMALGNAW